MFSEIGPISAAPVTLLDGGASACTGACTPRSQGVADRGRKKNVARSIMGKLAQSRAGDALGLWTGAKLRAGSGHHALLHAVRLYGHPGLDAGERLP